MRRRTAWRTPRHLELDHELKYDLDWTDVEMRVRYQIDASLVKEKLELAPWDDVAAEQWGQACEAGHTLTSSWHSRRETHSREVVSDLPRLVKEWVEISQAAAALLGR